MFCLLQTSLAAAEHIAWWIQDCGVSTKSFEISSRRFALFMGRGWTGGEDYMYGIMEAYIKRNEVFSTSGFRASTRLRWLN